MLMSVFTRVMEDAAFFAAQHRRLLSISASAFTTLAGLAVNLQPLPAAVAGCCTGPFGTGQCSSSNCNSFWCQNQCELVSGYCPGGGACWTSYACSPALTCCDCTCSTPQHDWWCYCYGG